MSSCANPYSILAGPGGEGLGTLGSLVGRLVRAARSALLQWQPGENLNGPRGVGTAGKPSPKRRTHTQGRYCLIAQQSTQDEDQMDADPTQFLAQSSTTLISVMW